MTSFDTRKTYSEGADDYAKAMREHWKFGSIETLKRAGIKPGDRVLDFGCGPGYGTLYAASKVGPKGYVQGVDREEEMLAIARQQATEDEVTNVDFRIGNFDDHTPGEGSSDAVVSSFALFFAEDTLASLKMLMSHLKPGGVLSFNSLTTNIHSPAMGYFLSECQALDYSIIPEVPWTRLSDPSLLRVLLREAGAVDVEIDIETLSLQLESPAVWWDMVLGSALRDFVLRLSEENQKLVRDRCMQWLTERDIREISLSVIYTRAVKP